MDADNWNDSNQPHWSSTKGFDASYAGYDDDETDKDPLEAIYALNIGDFIADSFISDDLLDKIHHSVGSDPDKLIRQLEELIQIYSVDRTLNILGFEAGKGFVLYDSIAATLCELFHADACHVFQVAKTETGDHSLSLTGTSLPISQSDRWNLHIPTTSKSTLVRAFKSDHTLSIADAQGQVDWEPIAQLGQTKTKSCIATPIHESSKQLGVLAIEYYNTTTLTPELTALADATARFFVTALRLQQLLGEAEGHIQHRQASLSDLQNLRAQITQSIADLGIHQQEFAEALAAAADARNEFTKGHSKQVAQIAAAIAQALSLNEKTADLIYYAGLLGNIGRIRVPQEILDKKETLSQDEWESLRNHLNVGVGLLVQINFLSEVVPYVRYQKAHWDGTNSPDGLSGRSIPLGARILGLADAYYAMTNERPYRNTVLTHTEALKQLAQEAGTKWDPMLVDVLSKIPEADLA